MNGEMAGLRRQLDTLDEELLRLLNQRAQISVEVGALKKAAGLPVLDAAREAVLLENLQKKNKGPLNAEQLYCIYHAILRVSKELQM